MKKLLLIFALIFVLLLVAIGAWILKGKQTSTQTAATSTPPVTFPTATGGDGQVAPVGAIQARSFLDDADVAQDPDNPGYYYLGYRTFGAQGVQNPPYLILFIKDTGLFQISLLQEPIGDARKAAEMYLQQKIGLTDDQMCSLDYFVSVPDSVNSRFASMNLGFSFCPGAVKLP